MKEPAGIVRAVLRQPGESRGRVKAMASGGFGSTLMHRAREAALRAKAADTLGITPHRNPLAGSEAQMSRPSYAPTVSAGNVQPPQPASLDVRDEEKMLKEVESFLAGIPRAGSV